MRKEQTTMDEPTTYESEELPHRPKETNAATIALRVWFMVLIVAAVFIFIKFFRRGGPGVALAMVAPAVVAASTQRTGKDRQAPKEVDQDFLKVWLSRIAVEDPLMTPAELCGVLNILFQEDGRPEPFDSPSQMARELKKLGLQSSVRSVRGRSERRWYDLTGFGTHAPAQ
jgi:hypothetical protein